MKAAFLDRDGVINPLVYHKDAGIVDSPFTLSQFRIPDHVPRAIRLLNDAGLAVIVVSNQPGIAKGHFEASLLSQFERKLRASLKTTGARIDAIYYCLHHPQAICRELRKHCQCRKPGIGMLTRASREMGIQLEGSYMVGDGLTDIEAGAKAGCRTVFIGRWKCEHCQFVRPQGLTPTFYAKNLLEASRVITADLRSSQRPPATKSECSSSVIPVSV
jgi:D-glycero-D-manno-heptose 1,7-bisphosphate phosphatase